MKHKHRIVPGYEGGKYVEENVVKLTPTQHAMWHFAEWLGRWLKSVTSDAADPGGLWDQQNLVFGDNLLTLAAQ